MQRERTSPERKRDEIDPGEDDFRSTKASGAFWFAMLGGPAATVFVTIIHYATVSRACEDENNAWLHVISVSALIVAVISLVTAYRLWKRTGGGDATPKFGVVHRGHFMTVVGLMSNSLAILGILMEWYPIFILGPCAGS
jgi:hypothetical protein